MLPPSRNHQPGLTTAARFCVISALGQLISRKSLNRLRPGFRITTENCSGLLRRRSAVPQNLRHASCWRLLAHLRSVQDRFPTALTGQRTLLFDRLELRRPQFETREFSRQAASLRNRLEVVSFRQTMRKGTPLASQSFRPADPQVPHCCRLKFRLNHWNLMLPSLNASQSPLGSRF